MTTAEPYRHRVSLPAEAEPVVVVGDEVQPGDVLARAVQPAASRSIPVARPLRRKRDEVAELLVVTPGDRVRADQPLARTADREVRTTTDALFLAYGPADGKAHLLLLEPADPIQSDVRGIVMEVDARSITIAVPGVMLAGLGGTGQAVHGPLSVMVSDPEAPLEPGAIDADSAGRVVIGGSWASAEAITRARAVGVAAIVVGGIHARELADFAGQQHRRSLLGTAAPPFAVLALDGFGRAGMDPARFAWLGANNGQRATVLGDQRKLIVYDASPAPKRTARPVVGDRVVIVSGPGRGQAGLLTEIPAQPMATGSGINALCGMVRLDPGRTVAVPLANIEASFVVS
ncbi:MAG: hypothetical protein ACRDFZ_08410 [Candidatus Limnocylindria bacterium]